MPIVTPSRMFTTPFIIPTVTPEEPNFELTTETIIALIVLGGVFVTFLLCAMVGAVICDWCEK